MFTSKCKKLLAAAAAIGILCGMSFSVDAASREEIAQVSVNKRGTNFQYWNKDAAAKQRLIAFVKEATNPKSANFIPVEDRIAVFDMDGTIIGETTPYYFEWMLYLDRVYNDPSYTPSAKILQNAKIVKQAIANKTVTMEIDEMETLDKLAVLAGLDDEEFDKVVKHAMNNPAPGMTNIKYGEMVYLPMAEVLSYLKANNFTLYIVSAGNRQIIRHYAAGVLPIPSNHIIGCDAVLKATHQGDKSMADYIFDVNKDEIITTEKLLERADVTGKAVKIAREIGKKPVLSFGNSMGDAAMHQYTLSNKKYKTLAFEILCDDTQREYGDLDKAAKIKNACDNYGWVPVSMRDDWKTIYGENVTRKNN